MFTVTEKKLTDSREKAKILADNRESHHPIEILLYCLVSFPSFILRHFVTAPIRDTIQTILQLYGGPSPRLHPLWKIPWIFIISDFTSDREDREDKEDSNRRECWRGDANCTRYLYCLLR